jgi:hypothetical protein
MAGLVPAIHVFGTEQEGVDARDKPGHDGGVSVDTPYQRLTLVSFRGELR